MEVVEVKREKPHLVRAKFDNGPDLLIDLDLANDISLKVGKILTVEETEELKEQSDYIRAKSRALWYLDRADRTEKGLYDKLVTAKFNKNSCAKVIARLKDLGLLDDVRYANRLCEKLSQGGTSKREIYAKLIAKGIKRDLAKETVGRLEGDEIGQIKHLIDKKYAGKMTDKEGIAKVYAALVRKGFSYGDVSRALKQYSEDINEDYV